MKFYSGSGYYAKTFFSTAKSKSLNFNYPIYRRPMNYLNVSEFIEKFKSLPNDVKEEKVSLTGTR